MPIIERFPQNSDDWKRAHIGRPTAGNFHKILSPVRMKLSSQRRRYMWRLVAETVMNEYLPEREITGEAGYWLDRGINMEGIARQQFERDTQMLVEPIGFIRSDDGKLGCSPDGLIVGSNDKEVIELKAPAPWTHVEYMLAKEDEETWQRYRCQVQGQILIGGFDAVHFYSYHPDWPPKYVQTLPNVMFIKTLKQALADFIGELEQEKRRAREMREVWLARLGPVVGDRGEQGLGRGGTANQGSA